MVGLMALVAIVERGGPARVDVDRAVRAAGRRLYFYGSLAASANHLHYHDGTFSLRAPFLKTLAISTGRLFWFWGCMAAATLAAWRAVRLWKLAAVAAGWIVITFLPYSFLTYMPRVPSRHTYFASAGLALIVGAWLWTLWERRGPGRRWAVGALAAIIVIHNCGYIWTRETPAVHGSGRCRPSGCSNTARQTPGPVPVRCFPYPMVIAELALDIELGKPMEVVEGRRARDSAMSIRPKRSPTRADRG